MKSDICIHFFSGVVDLTESDDETVIYEYQHRNRQSVCYDSTDDEDEEANPDPTEPEQCPVCKATIANRWTIQSSHM